MAFETVISDIAAPTAITLTPLVSPVENRGTMVIFESVSCEDGAYASDLMMTEVMPCPRLKTPSTLEFVPFKASP